MGKPKTAMRYYHIFIKMTKLKKKKKQYPTPSAAKDTEQLELSYVAGGKEKSTAPLRNSLDFLQS